MSHDYNNGLIVIYILDNKRYCIVAVAVSRPRKQCAQRAYLQSTFGGRRRVSIRARNDDKQWTNSTVSTYALSTDIEKWEIIILTRVG